MISHLHITICQIISQTKNKTTFNNKSIIRRQQLLPYILSGILAKDRIDLTKANICEYQRQYNTGLNIKYKTTLYYTILQQRHIKS